MLYEVITILKADSKLKHIPIIAFTASALKEDTQKIEEADFDGYLRKPFSKKDLVSKLCMYLKYREETLNVESEEKKEEVVKPSKVSNLPELIKVLEEDIVPNWEAIKNTFILGEFKNLAAQVRDVITSYSIHYTKLYDIL